MFSDLTEAIVKLDTAMRQKDGVERSEDYKRLLELSSLVVALSRKVDKLDGD